MKEKGMDNHTKFVILDDDRNTLVTAVLEKQNGQRKVFRMVSKPVCDLTQVYDINVMTVNSPTFQGWRGSLDGIRGEQLYFYATERIDESLRRHFRVDMKFTSCLYPIGVKPEPRIPIVSQDVSCGGVALFSQCPLDLNREYELVYPLPQPLILRVRVLRVLRAADRLYACIFSDLLPEEEALLQESIFEFDLRRNRRTQHGSK